jgi:hypothetical protein
MNIEIKKIHIYRGAHQDTVWLYLDLPNPQYPWTETLDLQFKAAHLMGLDYVRQHFPGVPISMIDQKGQETAPDNPPREQERTNEGSEADVNERQEADSGGGGPR